VPADLEPTELARLLDFAERPRVGDWSFRAALTRYAQPEPQRVGDLLELTRRIEFAIRPHVKAVEREGAAFWQALQSSDGSSAVEPFVVELLRAMVELDRLGDVLAAWALDPAAERPDALVDEITADVARRLEHLGVPREQRPRPARGRG
jgi:hypothetical protein